VQGEVKYLSAWSNLYIVFGFLFSIIFIFGAIYLQDPELYLYTIAPLGLIFIGFQLKKHPYMTYDSTNITVYGLLGNIRKQYNFHLKSDVTYKGNRFFVGERKVQANSWFVSVHDWRRAIEFFTDGKELMEELQD
jgi:hypothetical protein